MDSLKNCLKLLRSNLETFGFKKLRVQTLFRSENGVKYSGSLEQWQWGEEMILRLCEKLGMRREGLFLEFISFVNNPDGTPRYENTYQYAILKKEWNK